MYLWETRPEQDDSYCACGYNTTHLWIPAERSAHNARHRVYRRGVKLGKSFPYERLEDHIAVIGGDEPGYGSRVAYYLARAFNRLCGFDFVMWPYMGDYPMEGPEKAHRHAAYLYVVGGHAVGLLLGSRDYFSDTKEEIPAFVRLVFTAADYQRRGIATALAGRFAEDRGVLVSELVWHGPLTRTGADLVRRVSGERALVAGTG